MAQLTKDERFEVIAAAAGQSDLLALTDQLLPDLIVMDTGLPQTDLSVMTRTLKWKYPVIKIVWMARNASAEGLLEAMKQGAQGYLPKHLGPQVVADYLHAMMNEEIPVNDELAKLILREIPLGSQTPPFSGSGPLTSREKEILPLVAQGLTNPEIAAVLDISDQTVKNHLKNMLHKLQLVNRIQLTRYAMEQGWLKPKKGVKEQRHKEK